MRNQAENRVDSNESLVRELQVKLTDLEATKHSADLEVEQVKAQSHQSKMQMDMLESEAQWL